MVRNMTEGRPLQVIIAFSVPLFIGNLFQQLYNMVDTIVVGKFVGLGAMAAVGSAGSLTFLMTGFIIGLCPGLSIPVSQEFGAVHHDSMRRYVTNGLYVGLIISAIMTILSVTCARQFLLWMNTPEDIMADAYRYAVILFAAIPITFLYNFLSSIMRALGDSKTPLYFLIFASVLNIPLNLFFVLVVKTGTAGVSLATVLSQLISGLLCLFYIIRKFPMLKLNASDWKWSSCRVRRLIGIGLPMGLQHSITAIGSTILQTATNSFGSSVVAAVTAATKVVQLFFQVINTLGLTMATFCGQNLGARKIDRIQKGIRQSLILGIAYSFLIAIVSYFIGDDISALFLPSKTDPEIMGYINRFLLVTGFGYPFLTILMVLRNSIQGLGHSFLAMFSGVMEMSARVFLAFFMVKPFGYSAICFTFTAPWILANFLLIPGYFYVLQKTKLSIKGGKENE